jgi:hypothetical protein
MISLLRTASDHIFAAVTKFRESYGFLLRALGDLLFNPFDLLESRRKMTLNRSTPSTLNQFALGTCARRRARYQR